MNTQDYLASTLIIVVGMAVAALFELALPLYAARNPRPGRRRANLGMTAQTLLFNFGLTTAATALAAAGAWTSPAWMTAAGLPTAAQFVVGIVALDFAFGYFAHRAMHAWPPLWRFHRVHHSDAFVDVTTTYRTHPVESAWRFLCMMTVVWLLGVPAAAVLVYRVMSAVNGILEHANIRVSPGLDTAISRLWVTPNFHKVHHSRDSRETDTNYGNLLSLYDRVLGTATPSARGLSVVYGLEDAGDDEPESLGGLLAMPFRGAGDPSGARWGVPGR